VARDQPGPRLRREVGEQVVGAVHAGQVGEDGERAIAFDLLVEVQRVGGQHHRARRRADGHDQLTWRVAADLDQVDGGRDRVLAGDEREPALVVHGLEQGDLVWLGVRGELGAAGDRAGPELVLGPAHHDLRPRELVQVPGVIPVSVGHHDGRDHVRVDAELAQRVGGRGVPVAAAPITGGGSESRVHQGDRAVAVADDPEVVIDRLLRVRLAVKVIVEESFSTCGDTVPETDRQHLARTVVAGHATPR